MSAESCDGARGPILAFNGELTIYTAVESRKRLLEALAGEGAVEVDLSGVTEIDSAGLQLLIMAKKEANLAGRGIRFVNHSSPVVELIDLCDLGRFFGDPVVMFAPQGAQA